VKKSLQHGPQSRSWTSRSLQSSGVAGGSSTNVVASGTHSLAPPVAPRGHTAIGIDMNGEERRGNKERKKEREMGKNRKNEKTKNRMNKLYCH
jgi:hypothetical protein